MITTAGKALINSILPKELRDYNRAFSKKEVSGVLNIVAKQYPHLYKDIVLQMKILGGKLGHINGNSFRLSHFKLPTNKDILKKEGLKMQNIKFDDKKLLELSEKFWKIRKKLEDATIKYGLKQDNLLVKHVVAGARGKPGQVATTITSPVMYVDPLGKPIPIPIINSIAEGLDPVELWASSYGARKGVIATKFATPKGGFFSKQLGYVTGDMLVTEDDCETANGMKMITDDRENIGRLLAVATSVYPKNTVITNTVISDLLKKKIKHILVRSPITCKADNGICKKCYGYTYNGTYPSIGENIGINGSAALSEPFTQGAMREKHTGGTIQLKKQGFPLIEQLLKIPKIFAGGAVVSEKTGHVSKIEKAPQGGFYVTVDETKHYVEPDKNLLVREKEKIEAGLPLSKGIINPADVTRLRGIGEGRKFLAETLKNVYNNSGLDVNKIHMETLAKAIVKHVRINDNNEFNDFVPGDIVSLERAQKEYEPVNPKIKKPKDAIGNYLSKPYMHYTMGTQITNSIAKELASSKVDKVNVTEHEMPFTPLMIRMDDVPSHKENWLERLYSIHLKSKIMESVAKGEEAKLHGKSFVPAFIYGKEFGKPKIGY